MEPIDQTVLADFVPLAHLDLQDPQGPPVYDGSPAPTALPAVEHAPFIPPKVERDLLVVESSDEVTLIQAILFARRAGEHRLADAPLSSSRFPERAGLQPANLYRLPGLRFHPGARDVRQWVFHRVDPIAHRSELRQCTKQARKII